MIKLKGFLMIGASMFFAGTSAQEISYSRDTIQSSTFGTERIISLAIPSDFNGKSADSYMRIYIFDAQFDAFYKMATEIAGYLQATGFIQPFLAVGIHTENRPREFIPAPRSPGEHEGWGGNPIGEADLLRAFITKEVEPMLDEKYPSSPLRLAIAHSLAGTFALHDAMRSDAIFKAVIAISPNTVYDDEQLVQDFATVLAYDAPPNHYAFVSAGTEGKMENNFRAASSRMDSIYTTAKKTSTFIFRYKVYEGLGHSETPVATIADGLVDFGKYLTLDVQKAESFLNDPSLSYFDHVKAWYAEKWYWLGFDRLPSATEINGLGYIAAEKDQWGDALELFDWAITLYPNDANVYDSRAEAFLKLGRKKEAVSSYQKALEVLEIQKATMHPEDYAFYLTMIQANIKAAEEAK